MPELPEVETVAADLRAELVGCTFTSSHIGWARTLGAPNPEQLAARLAGRTVVDVGRRGKFLLLHLDSGEALVVHLRMTGQLSVVPAGSPLLGDVHVRAWFGLADGRWLVFHDARKFGRIWLVADVAELTRKLGPEPLGWEFTPQGLAARLKKRRAAVKGVLLDQAVVAGIGNIYADESLFLAGIHPLRPGASLTEEELGRLCAAIRTVLEEAIGSRGTLLRDYRTLYGADGEYQEHLRVYRRTGQACPRCGATIERIRITQRSSHFCPRCQPVAEKV